MDKSRILLYVRPSDSDGSVASMLRGNFWVLSEASDKEYAKFLQQSLHFRVGIAEISNWDNDAWLQHLESLLAMLSEISWILILPEQKAELSRKQQLKKTLLASHCHDFHRQPVDSHDLLFTLGHAYGMADLCAAADPLPREYPGRYGIVGDSPAMHRLYRMVKKVAAEDKPVLILGETGTGKEMIARAIHQNSRRSESPMVVVNCAALTESLVQAEFFGYEKGAFTGAFQRKAGYIENAAGGTLFLDEIGDLPLSQQANLLRFLQEHTIQRVGGYQDIYVDTRVIAATHVDLKAAVDAGTFRSDLYYRLQVLSLALPPLRERVGDIELLARYFFDQFSRDNHYKARNLSNTALQMMDGYNWPGNVRELCNRVNRAVVLSDNRFLSPEDLGLERSAVIKPELLDLAESKGVAEKVTIMRALEASHHNVTRAAGFLNVSRATLYRLIDKYHLQETPA